jgi:acetyl esterase
VALDPKARQLLDEVRASHRPNAHLLPVPEARANFEALFADLGSGPQVASVTDIVIPLADVRIPARVYRPEGRAPPIVVYLHGGGWLLGSIDSHDLICRQLANAGGAVVVSVGYRLAPEHRFPAAVDDAVGATRWLSAHGGELGADAARVAVAGDSAGGNLAAVVALEVAPLALQLLVYPVTTTALDRGFDMQYEGYFLYRDEMAWHQELYLRSPEDASSPRVSPLGAPDHSAAPPAFIVAAECDPLHLQSEAYADRLSAAGVVVELVEYAGMIHGFFGLGMLFDAAAEAMADAGAALRRAFA